MEIIFYKEILCKIPPLIFYKEIPFKIDRGPPAEKFTKELHVILICVHFTKNSHVIFFYVEILCIFIPDFKLGIGFFSDFAKETPNFSKIAHIYLS